MVLSRSFGRDHLETEEAVLAQARAGATGVGVPGGQRARVLVVEDDPSEAQAFLAVLRLLPLDALWCRTGSEALAAARDQRIDLVLVEVELPDISGVDAVRALRESGDSPRVILVTRQLRASIAVEAMQVGAIGVLEWPCDPHDVIVTVQTALQSAHARQAPRPFETRRAAGPIAERWAHLVLRTLHAERDPKTIVNWAKAIGVSRTVLCECCRLLRVAPHEARDFSRLLRAIWRSDTRWQPEAILDLADARTLKKMLARAGVGAEAAPPPTPLEFLDKQQWIPSDNPGLIALRALLTSDGRRRSPSAR